MARNAEPRSGGGYETQWALAATWTVAGLVGAAVMAVTLAVAAIVLGTVGVVVLAVVLAVTCALAARGIHARFVADEPDAVGGLRLDVISGRQHEVGGRQPRVARSTRLIDEDL